MSTRKQFIEQGGFGLFSLLLMRDTFHPDFSDTEGIVVNEEEGEILQWPDRVTGDGTVRITIKISKLNNTDTISFLSESFLPGDGIKVHKHSNEAELIFIHKGTGILTLGEKEHKVQQGSVALVPKGIWHGLKNTGTENIDMRFAYMPAGFEGYFRELGTPLGKPFVRRSVEEKRIIGRKWGIIRKEDVMPNEK
ncbi:MAG TPA: cupin domain-containing protein [Sphingobacteriaceae bacterium]